MHTVKKIEIVWQLMPHSRSLESFDGMMQVWPQDSLLEKNPPISCLRMSQSSSTGSSLMTNTQSLFSTNTDLVSDNSGCERYVPAWILRTLSTSPRWFTAILSVIDFSQNNNNATNTIPKNIKLQIHFHARSLWSTFSNRACSFANNSRPFFVDNFN